MGAPLADSPEELITEAARVWCGFGVESYPQRSIERLTTRFGDVMAGTLGLLLDDLERDFYRFGPINWDKGFETVLAAVSARFRELHPGIPDGVIEVFEWSWSWDHR
jgi:hypothetical protein